MKKTTLILLTLLPFVTFCQETISVTPPEPIRLDTIAPVKSGQFNIGEKTYRILVGDAKTKFLPRVSRQMLILTDKKGKVQNYNVRSYKLNEKTINFGNDVKISLESLKVGENAEISISEIVDLDKKPHKGLVSDFNIERIK